MQSSDEEDSQRLREALDPEFMNESLFVSNSSRKKENESKTPLSLRPKQNEDDQFNSLGVTPQFQKYVANALSALLDKELEKRLVNVRTEVIKKKKRNRIKLLSDSEKCLKLHKEKTPDRPKPKCDSDSEDGSKIVEAAVSPIDIINKTDVKNWSMKTKGKVFRYRTSTGGVLTLID